VVITGGEGVKGRVQEQRHGENVSESRREKL
jgi:hypothetical protein